MVVGRCARTIGADGVQGMDEWGGGMRVVLGREGGEAEEVRVVGGQRGVREWECKSRL